MAPATTIMPMSRGLILYWAADRSATGATMATPAELNAPTPVTTVVRVNMIQGTSPTLPLTSLTPQFMSRSTVPLFCAMAKRKVTPAEQDEQVSGEDRENVVCCQAAIGAPPQRPRQTP